MKILILPISVFLLILFALASDAQTTCLGANCSSGPTELEQQIDRHFMFFVEQQYSYETMQGSLPPGPRQRCFNKCRLQYFQDKDWCDRNHHPRTGFGSDAQENSQDYSVCMAAMRGAFSTCLSPLGECAERYPPQ